MKLKNLSQLAIQNEEVQYANTDWKNIWNSLYINNRINKQNLEIFNQLAGGFIYNHFRFQSSNYNDYENFIH